MVTNKPMAFIWSLNYFLLNYALPIAAVPIYQTPWGKNSYYHGQSSLQYCKDGFFVIPSTKNFENLMKSAAAKVAAAANFSVILKPLIKIETLGFY